MRPELSPLDDLADAVCVAEESGRLVYANPAAQRLLLISASESGDLGGDELTRATEGALAALCHEVLQDGQPRELELFHRPTGRWLGHRVSRSGAEFWVVSRDTTAHRIAQTRLEILSLASRALGERIDDREIFETVARLVSEALRDLCVIRLTTDDGGHFGAPIGAWDVDPDLRALLAASGPTQADSILDAQIIATGRSVVLPNISAEDALTRIKNPALRELVRRLDTHSVIIAPLLSAGRVVGILSIARRRTGTRAPYSDAERVLVEEIAASTALVVTRSTRLREIVESRAQLRELVEESPFAMAMFDRDMRYVYASRRWVLDYKLPQSSEQLRGRSHYDVFPEISEDWRSIHRRALAGEVVRHDGEAFPRADGTVDWVRWEVRPWRAADGSIIGIMVFSEDVSERKKAEQVLEGARDRLEAARSLTGTIAANASLGLFMMDARQYCTFMNPAAERITGFRLEELQDKPLHDYIHHSHPDGTPYQIADCPIDRALPEENETRGDDVFIHRDGHFYPVSFTASPIVEAGTPVGTVIELRDMTEERAAERERERLLADTRKAVAVRDEFLSIASHELRTPLTALELQLEGIRRGLQGELGVGRIDQKLGRASDQMARLNALIEGLLDVSRIATGRFSLDLEDVELSLLVGEVTERFEEEARRSGCVISLKVPETVRGRWDRSRLDQVLTNLLTNALKYGNRQPIEIVLEERADRVRLAVRDHGIGIGPEDRSRIFGRFERAVPSNQYGGLGLGLYIVSEIITAHHGTIDVESELGRGTTFTLVLPRITDARPSS